MDNDVKVPPSLILALAAFGLKNLNNPPSESISQTFDALLSNITRPLLLATPKRTFAYPRAPSVVVLPLAYIVPDIFKLAAEPTADIYKLDTVSVVVVKFVIDVVLPTYGRIDLKYYKY